MLLVQLLLNAAVNAAIFSLLAVGFGMVYRSMRFFYIAFGAVYVLASYITLACGRILPAAPAVAAGLLGCAAFGALMELGVHAPLRRRRASPEILFIASLGAYIITVNTIALFFGNELQTLSQGYSNGITMAGLVVTRMQAVQFVVGWLAVGGFVLTIRRHSYFKAVWALGDTPELIRALGFPVRRMRLVVLALSSLFAGIAGLLTSFDIGIDPHAGMSALLTGAVAVLVGGRGSYRGWIGGACLLAVLQALAVWQFSSRWNDLVTFSILVLTLLWRPEGLFAARKRREET